MDLLAVNENIYRRPIQHSQTALIGSDFFDTRQSPYFTEVCFKIRLMDFCFKRAFQRLKKSSLNKLPLPPRLLLQFEN